MAQNITLIGLGKMGSAMAEKFLESDFSFTVYNRTFEKTKPLVSMGAQVADSLESAVHNADIVFTSLFDDEALITVTKTILKHLKQGAIHVSTSTVLPKTASMLSKWHTDADCFYIAAPIVGSSKALKEKKVMTVCSGHKHSIDRVTSLLQTYSSSVKNIGEHVSHANILKICMNYSLITAFELISEFYAFAEKSGLDTKIVHESLKNIYGLPAYHLYIDKIYHREFNDVYMDMQCGDKDVGLFQQAFLEVGVNPDIANVLRGKFTQALTSGMSNKDWSGMSEIVRQRSGLKES